MLPVTNANGQSHKPSPTMHSKLVCQDKTQTENKSLKTIKTVKTFPKKRDLNSKSFATKSLIRSLQSTWFQSTSEGTNRHKTIFKASALRVDAFYKSRCPSVCPSVHLSVRLSVCLSVCVFTFEVPFNGLFDPTSRSRMSNIFRDSESLEKSNGKKWSNIWTFLFGNGLKSPRKKKKKMPILRVITALTRWYVGYNRLIPF